VDAVARDFDLGDPNITPGVVAASGSNGGGGADKFDLVQALRSLATLADRLKEEDKEARKDLPEERKL
jgi:hypothetical protein